jgi:hypothetical protein
MLFPPTNLEMFKLKFPLKFEFRALFSDGGNFDLEHKTKPKSKTLNSLKHFPSETAHKAKFA